LADPDALPVHYLRPGMHEVSVFFDKRDQVRLTIAGSM
jgi:hypothetical protein